MGFGGILLLAIYTIFTGWSETKTEHNDAPSDPKEWGVNFLSLYLLRSLLLPTDGYACSSSCTKYTASQHLLSVFAIQFILFSVLLVYTKFDSTESGRAPLLNSVLSLTYTMVGIKRPTHTQNWQNCRLTSWFHKLLSTLSASSFLNTCIYFINVSEIKRGCSKWKKVTMFECYSLYNAFILHGCCTYTFVVFHHHYHQKKNDCNLPRVLPLTLFDYYS